MMVEELMIQLGVHLPMMFEELMIQVGVQLIKSLQKI